MVLSFVFLESFGEFHFLRKASKEVCIASFLGSLVDCLWVFWVSLMCSSNGLLICFFLALVCWYRWWCCCYLSCGDSKRVCSHTQRVATNAPFSFQQSELLQDLGSVFGLWQAAR